MQYNELYSQDIGYHDGGTYSKKVFLEDELHTEVIAKQNPFKKESKQSEETQSLIGFILMVLGGGLLAIFTPCVFPMIPLTVSFFTNKSKEGQSKIAPLIYGLSIILI